jgi:hypothetical protein
MRTVENWVTDSVENGVPGRLVDNSLCLRMDNFPAIKCGYSSVRQYKSYVHIWIHFFPGLKYELKLYVRFVR